MIRACQFLPLRYFDDDDDDDDDDDNDDDDDVILRAGVSSFLLSLSIFLGILILFLSPLFKRNKDKQVYFRAS